MHLQEKKNERKGRCCHSQKKANEVQNSAELLIYSHYNLQMLNRKTDSDRMSANIFVDEPQSEDSYVVEDEPHPEITGIVHGEMKTNLPIFMIRWTILQV
jgi:hypothetical protein